MGFIKGIRTGGEKFGNLRMNSTQVLDIQAEAHKAGVNTEDWSALMAWIKKEKGEEAATNFEERCQCPI